MRALLLSLVVVIVSTVAMAGEQLLARIVPPDYSVLELAHLGSDWRGVASSDSGEFYDLQISLDGSLVGFLELLEGEPPRARFHLVDPSGTEVLSINHVWRFAISRSERIVAYIKGDYREGGPGFRNASLHLLNLEDRSLTSIDLSYPTRLNWISTNEGDILYVKTIDGEVTRVNPRTGSLKPEGRRGFNRSPDGAFYIVRGEELEQRGGCNGRDPSDPCAVIVEARTGHEIVPEPTVGGAAAYRWVPSRPHHLLIHHRAPDGSALPSVLDVEKGVKTLELEPAPSTQGKRSPVDKKRRAEVSTSGSTEVDPQPVSLDGKGTVNFDFDLHEPILSEERLAPLLGSLLRDRKLRVFVAGHADSVGEQDYNCGLSARRADTVVDVLMARLESQDRLAGVWACGEGQPVESNSSPEGRAMNRRVEVFVDRSDPDRIEIIRSQCRRLETGTTTCR